MDQEQFTFILSSSHCEPKTHVLNEFELMTIALDDDCVLDESIEYVRHDHHGSDTSSVVSSVGVDDEDETEKQLPADQDTMTLIPTDTLRVMIPPIYEEVILKSEIVKPAVTRIDRVYRHNPYLPCVLKTEVEAPPTTNVSQEPKPMCCYFKQKGYCKMGEACWYAHSGDLYTPCHYGTSCKAGHATLTLMRDAQYVPHSFLHSATDLAHLSGVTVRIGSRY